MLHLSLKMSREVFLFAVLTLIHLRVVDCYKFSITRDLNSGKELEKSFWIGVEVNTTESTDDDSDGDVTVKFEIPKALNLSFDNSDAFVFFANDAKEILQVNLNSTIQGKFYTTPHKLEKELKGNETSQTEEEKFIQLSGKIPVTWLPKNCSKISAAVIGPDYQYYNYYKIQIFKISIPDLMVVEEYKKLSSQLEEI